MMLPEPRQMGHACRPTRLWLRERVNLAQHSVEHAPAWHAAHSLAVLEIARADAACLVDPLKDDGGWRVL
eukprot:998973-Lingulodinium_polyedra.AAC.1